MDKLKTHNQSLQKRIENLEAIVVDQDMESLRSEFNSQHDMDTVEEPGYGKKKKPGRLVFMYFLRDSNILMRLLTQFPVRIFLYVPNDTGGHCFSLAPFRLEIEQNVFVTFFCM